MAILQKIKPSLPQNKLLPSSYSVENLTLVVRFSDASGPIAIDLLDVFQGNIPTEFQNLIDSLHTAFQERN